MSMARQIFGLLINSLAGHPLQTLHHYAQQCMTNPHKSPTSTGYLKVQFITEIKKSQEIEITRDTIQ